MNKLEQELAEIIQDHFEDRGNTLSKSLAARIIMPKIEAAFDSAKGYYTDTEYVPGASKEEWIKINITGE